MGQTLSEPVTVKHTEGDRDHRLLYAASAMQGWRLSMEDAHTTLLKLKSPDNSDKHHSFFAVFDGHGGKRVAIYSGMHLHDKIVSEPAFAEEDFATALKKGFLRLDEEMKNDESFKVETSGCTAVSVLITDDWRIFCSNAGDSRAVMSRGGKAVALSNDHKPFNPEEKRRIVAAGGFVELGRVNGNLALSRALGDFEFKKSPSLPAEEQIVTCDPEITEYQLTDDDEFAVIACDGIFDCATNDHVVNYVRLGISQGKTLEQICEALMSQLIARDNNSRNGLGLDNMTVVIVAFLKGRSEAAWRKMVKDRFDAAGLRIEAIEQNEYNYWESETGENRTKTDESTEGASKNSAPRSKNDDDSSDETCTF